jgi:hypothetical protein
VKVAVSTSTFAYPSRRARCWHAPQRETRLAVNVHEILAQLAEQTDADTAPVDASDAGPARQISTNSICIRLSVLLEQAVRSEMRTAGRTIWGQGRLPKH